MTLRDRLFATARDVRARAAGLAALPDVRRAVLLIAVAVVGYAAGHALFLEAAPRLAMGEAERKLSGDFTAVNVWRHAPRQTPQTRSLGRPAPELAYSSCVYDLSDGPVRIRAAGWAPYMSVALYDDTAVNYFVAAGAEPVDLLVVARGSPVPQTDARVVVSPARRGAAMIRRVAPTDADWSAIPDARAADVCASAASGDAP